MKKFFLFLFFAAAIFFFSFVAARMWDKSVQKPPVAITQPCPYTLKNHPFTFVVVGYNNGASLGKTLRSIFSQNYENYRLIYIDDHSDDGSFDLVTDLVGECGRFLQVTLVQNEMRLGLLANVIRAVESCQNDEIVVILQAHDWLSHEWVLQKLNAYYANPDLWITMSQFREFPSYNKGPSCELHQTNIRNTLIDGAYLQSFYASLFKKINPADFSSGGKFFPSSGELAYMLPMLEMGRKHARFIPEVLTLKNTTIHDPVDIELQVRCEKFIRSLDSYQPIVSLMGEICGE